MKARILTIGTELTSGEVVNSNAAWMSAQLEDKGLRVYSHLTVRDEFTEIAAALSTMTDARVLIVSGGLGPTTDDITREALARFAAVPLEFDERVWTELQALYQTRALKILEAHKHQCYFPKGSVRLKNSNGTALGFAMAVGEGNTRQDIFVVPGPPAEMQKVWAEEVAPRLQSIVPATSYEWKRWITLGVPESEVAQNVEEVLAAHSRAKSDSNSNSHGSSLNEPIEVGYRASYPYVRVKAYLDAAKSDHQKVESEITRVLAKGLVGRGTADLAEELLKAWPAPVLNLNDELSEHYLFTRLLAARKILVSSGQMVPEVRLSFNASGSGSDGLPKDTLHLRQDGDSFKVSLATGAVDKTETSILPFKIPITSERGRRGASERALWTALKWLKLRD